MMTTDDKIAEALARPWVPRAPFVDCGKCGKDELQHMYIRLMNGCEIWLCEGDPKHDRGV
jgi:hypothetical protein